MLNKSSHKLVPNDYDMSGVKENDRLLQRGRQSSNLEGRGQERALQGRD